MFTIYDGREKFFQWDKDRKLIVEDAEITEVHFCNRTDECSLVCETYVEDGLTLVNVPNILLQNDWRINVFAYNQSYTKFKKCFDVVSRSKPADYVYTETEIKNYDALEARVTALEAGGAGEDISLAIEKHNESEDAHSQILKDYAKTTAIPTKVSQLENDAKYIDSLEQPIGDIDTTALFLDTNKVYRVDAKNMQLTGFDFYFYTPEDTSITNQILIYLDNSTYGTIHPFTWTYVKDNKEYISPEFINGEEPTIGRARYRILAEYNPFNENWVVGVVPDGAVLD